jgi:hypothetical protein
MTSGMTAFMVAVGGTSLICYLLMNRVQYRKSERNSAGGDASGTSSSGSSAATSGTCFPGSAATVLRRIAPPRPAIPAGTAEEAVGMAIDAENRRKISASVI